MLKYLHKKFKRGRVKWFETDWKMGLKKKGYSKRYKKTQESIYIHN